MFHGKNQEWTFQNSVSLLLGFKLQDESLCGHINTNVTGIFILTFRCSQNNRFKGETVVKMPAEHTYCSLRHVLSSKTRSSIVEN